MIQVFVYGSLKEGESNHHVIEPFVQEVATGQLPGELLHLGPYPALYWAGTIVSEEGTHPASVNLVSTVIRGEWMCLHEDAWGPMDALEGFISPGHPDNDYERIWVEAIDDFGQARAGWTYVYTERRGYPVIPGGIWRDALSRR